MIYEGCSSSYANLRGTSGKPLISAASNTDGFLVGNHTYLLSVFVFHSLMQIMFLVKSCKSTAGFLFSTPWVWRSLQHPPVRPPPLTNETFMPSSVSCSCLSVSQSLLSYSALCLLSASFTYLLSLSSLTCHDSQSPSPLHPVVTHIHTSPTAASAFSCCSPHWMEPLASVPPVVSLDWIQLGRLFAL